MEPTVLSPLQLECCTLHRLLIEADPSVHSEPEGGQNYKVGLAVDGAADEKGRRHKVTLSFRLERPEDRPDQPLKRVEVDLEGLFALPDDAPQEMVDALVPGNCVAMLYGVMRGIVAQATGVTGPGPLWLPSVNVRALLADRLPKSNAPTEGKPKRIAARKRAPRREVATPDP